MHSSCMCAKRMIVCVRHLGPTYCAAHLFHEIGARPARYAPCACLQTPIVFVGWPLQRTQNARPAHGRRPKTMHHRSCLRQRTSSWHTCAPRHKPRHTSAHLVKAATMKGGARQLGPPTRALIKQCSKHAASGSMEMRGSAQDAGGIEKTAAHAAANGQGCSKHIPMLWVRTGAVRDVWRMSGTQRRWSTVLFQWRRHSHGPTAHAFMLSRATRAPRA